MCCSSGTLPWRRWPKWKSAPTTTSRACSALDEQLFDELLGGLLAARRVEREHEAYVDGAGRVEQLELLLEGRQQLRRRVGPHDLGRMAVEGEHGRRQTAGVGELAHEPQHRLVPEVHAVERADRDDAAARPDVARDSAGSR